MRAAALELIRDSAHLGATVIRARSSRVTSNADGFAIYNPFLVAASR